MASILSLFSDAEMKGSAILSVPGASSVSVPKQVSASKVCAADSSAVGGLSSEWLCGFDTNPVEERERLSAPARYGGNPCNGCIYQGLCDDDYCAMLLHPIDMPHAPTARGWKVFGL